MKFTKMHGTGNDYIYINLFEGYEDSVPAVYDGEGRLTEIEDKPVTDVIVKVSDRHFGIGSDGLIAVAPSQVADVRMIMYNADGSEGAMCGNGIRCVAKFAYDKGLTDGIRVEKKVKPDETDDRDLTDGKQIRMASENDDRAITDRGETACKETVDQEYREITVETASGVKKLKLTIEHEGSDPTGSDDDPSGCVNSSPTKAEDSLWNDRGVCTYVDVNMGQAILFPAQIPVDVSYIGGLSDRMPNESGKRTKDRDILNNLLDSKLGGESVSAIVSRRLQASGREYAVTCVSMGNPHCVIFTDGIDDLDLEKLGPRFENHPAFPERINTEFVEIIDDHTVKMRVWERGSGETMSCGTGTCAVTVAAVLNGYVARGRETEVRIRGGSLYDTWLDSGEVHMKGPAETVFEGEIKLE